MSTLIIDYGMGNLGSVRRAFEECGANAVVSDDPRDIKHADHLVLPGVGSFADGMQQLRKLMWVEPLIGAVRETKLPLLGICLGMQLLADLGNEGGETPGLGLVPGTVKRLEPGDPLLRVPHVGWNEVHAVRSDLLLSEVPDDSDFYFVHSYCFLAKDNSHIIATTPYGGDFVSVIGRDTVYGVQFHPEKSSSPGFKLISNFLQL